MLICALYGLIACIAPTIVLLKHRLASMHVYQHQQSAQQMTHIYTYDDHLFHPLSLALLLFYSLSHYHQASISDSQYTLCCVVMMNKQEDQHDSGRVDVNTNMTLTYIDYAC